jgi:predicted choloylglycine hydrolase
MNNKTIKFDSSSFEGSSYDIGYKLGKHYRKKFPFLKFFLLHPLFPKVTKEKVEDMTSILTKYDPELLMEMKGFSKATNISLDKVLVKLGGYGFQPTIVAGCTQLAILPCTASTNNSIVGRNYDFSNKKIYSDMQLLSLYPETGNNVIGMAQFAFGRIEGINSYGLYAGLSVAHGKGKSDNGILSTMVIRILLDKCKTIHEATELIHKLPHSYSYNYLIADKQNAYAIEVCPPKIVVRKPEHNYISICNHFESDKLKDDQLRIIPTTIERTKTIEKIIDESSILDLNTVKNILSGHSNKGVCLHHYNDFLGTIWSGIFNLTTGDAYYSFGAPCSNDYHKMNFQNNGSCNDKHKGNIPRNEAF